MEIVKEKSMRIKLTKDELKEAVELFLTKHKIEHKKVTELKDYTRSEYEPMGNTEGETFYYFDGVYATVEV